MCVYEFVFKVKTDLSVGIVLLLNFLIMKLVCFCYRELYLTVHVHDNIFLTDQIEV